MAERIIGSYPTSSNSSREKYRAERERRIAAGYLVPSTAAQYAAEQKYKEEQAKIKAEEEAEETPLTTTAPTPSVARAELSVSEYGGRIEPTTFREAPLVEEERLRIVPTQKFKQKAEEALATEYGYQKITTTTPTYVGASISEPTLVAEKIPAYAKAMGGEIVSAVKEPYGPFLYKPSQAKPKEYIRYEEKIIKAAKTMPLPAKVGGYILAAEVGLAEPYVQSIRAEGLEVTTQRKLAGLPITPYEKYKQELKQIEKGADYLSAARQLTKAEQFKLSAREQREFNRLITKYSLPTTLGESLRRLPTLTAERAVARKEFQEKFPSLDIEKVYSKVSAREEKEYQEVLGFSKQQAALFGVEAAAITGGVVVTPVVARGFGKVALKVPVVKKFVEKPFVTKLVSKVPSPIKRAAEFAPFEAPIVFSQAKEYGLGAAGVMSVTRVTTFVKGERLIRGGIERAKEFAFDVEMKYYWERLPKMAYPVREAKLIDVGYGERVGVTVRRGFEVKVRDEFGRVKRIETQLTLGKVPAERFLPEPIIMGKPERYVPLWHMGKVPPKKPEFPPMPSLLEKDLSAFRVGPKTEQFTLPYFLPKKVARVPPELLTYKRYYYPKVLERPIVTEIKRLVKTGKLDYVRVFGKGDRDFKDSWGYAITTDKYPLLFGKEALLHRKPIIGISKALSLEEQIKTIRKRGEITKMYVQPSAKEVLYHELLHIKYPELKEKQVRELTQMAKKDGFVIKNVFPVKEVKLIGYEDSVFKKVQRQARRLIKGKRGELIFPEGAFEPRLKHSERIYQKYKEPERISIKPVTELKPKIELISKKPVKTEFRPVLAQMALPKEKVSFVLPPLTVTKPRARIKEELILEPEKVTEEIIIPEPKIPEPEIPEEFRLTKIPTPRVPTTPPFRPEKPPEPIIPIIKIPSMPSGREPLEPKLPKKMREELGKYTPSLAGIFEIVRPISKAPKTITGLSVALRPKLGRGIWEKSLPKRKLKKLPMRLKSVSRSRRSRISFF